ncbi:MAG: diacylglycerol kinase family lipid kinase [Actinobacteria bacterium]|nr:diacylglycerol kinase family lipid kinase [Actinomycetota bacterium]
MRALLLYNPTATTTSAAVIDVITGALRSALQLEAVPTKRRNHAGFLAAGAADEGYEVVIVLGGDGTVNEVIQGIATTDVALAVIPGGSTNVLARSLGIPNEPIGATTAILRHLADDRIRRVTLGLANERYFAFHAGFGFDAEVVRQVEQRYLIKRTVRQASFIWCIVQAYVTARHVRRAQIMVRSPDNPLLSAQRWVVCANARPYTYLGSNAADLCPVADIAGDLGLTGVSRLSIPAILRVARTSLTSDAVGQLRFVDVLSDLPEVICDADRPLPLQLDGDYVGDHRSVRFLSIRDALRVVA